MLQALKDKFEAEVKKEEVSLLDKGIYIAALLLEDILTELKAANAVNTSLLDVEIEKAERDEQKAQAAMDKAEITQRRAT